MSFNITGFPYSGMPYPWIFLEYVREKILNRPVYPEVANREYFYLMQAAVAKPVPHALAGALLAGVLVLYSLVLTFTGLNTNRALGGVSLLLLAGGVAYFVWRQGTALGGGAAFGELFSYGFKATAVCTLVLIGFQWVFYTVFPEYREQLLDITREEMVRQGVPEAQMGSALASMRDYFWAMTIGGALFSTLLTGAVGSLIGAGLAKRR